MSKLFSSKHKEAIRFESDYGKTNGWSGPHEAGQFWYRWFPRGEHVYVPPGTSNSEDLRELRREITGMMEATNSVAVLKNTYNTMRIAPILEAIPEALFLVCHRDPLDIAQSILQGRITATGNKSNWWSVPPKEIDMIKQHPYWEQIVEQVYFVYKQIDDDRRLFDGRRFFDVSYQELCVNTHATLHDINSFLLEKKVTLQINGEVPDNFHFSTGKKIDNGDYALLLKKTLELWDQ